MKMAQLAVRLLMCATAFAGLAGCRKTEPESTSADRPTSPKEPPAAAEQTDEELDDFLSTTPQERSATGQLPPGHPPLNGATPAANVTGTDLKYEVPENWQSVPPTSKMRKAQFVLPGLDGANGQMVVFYFGPGQGGPTQMNLERWIGMFRKADGTPVGADGASVETKKVNDLNVTLLDITGIYQDPMGGQSTPTSVDYRLYAAVVERPDGEKWFFKAVGPAKTMATHRSGFDQLLESIN